MELAAVAQPLPAQAAALVVRKPGFGAGWSPYTRDRIRVRVFAAAGDNRARTLTDRLRDQDGHIAAALGTLFQALVFAGLFGMAYLLAASLRSRAGRLRGEADLDWLRKRYEGLPRDEPYHLDPLVPLLGFGAWLIVKVVAGQLVASFGGARTPHGLNTLGLGLLDVLLTIAVIYAFSRMAQPLQDSARLGGAGPGSFWQASTAALRAYCVLLPMVAMAALLGALLLGEGSQSHPVSSFLLDDADPLQIAALGIAVVVVAPVSEELLFRGFLYRILRHRVGIRRAMWATALLFACMHMAPHALPAYIVLGLGFALVYEWVGSLWASIVLHGLWNAVVFAMMASIALS